MKNRHLRNTVITVKRVLKSIWAEKQEYKDAYSLDLEINNVSENALNCAKDIRGKNNPPTLMLFGATTRSGTNYISNLLAYHPVIEDCPNNIYEIPFLRLTNHFISFQESFFNDYKRNREKMQENEFLPLFGASFISYLYSFVPQNKTMLVKEPDARFLRYLPLVFPHENALLVIRDGRDVVCSTINTWPDGDFKKICRRWNDSVRLMLTFEKKYKKKYMLVRYEDILNDPASMITDILNHYNLDSSKYPYEKIDKTPIVGSSTLSKKDDKVSWQPVTATKSFKPAGQWNNMPRKQIDILKQIAGDTLIAAGYCEDLDW